MTKYFTLYQLNKSIQKLILGIGKNFWITAELASVQANQHIYLELVQKEEDEIVARNRAIIWANQYEQLSQKLGTNIETILQEGSKVLIQVVVQFHEVHGISLTIIDLDINYTLGELALKRRETLQKLEEAELLHLQKELPLKSVLQKIAVISSPEAAGFTDFTNQLFHNQYNFHFEVQLFPAAVQGERAVKEIIFQLGKIPKDAFDIIVIIRGGGSQLDLEVFNQYELAEMIAQSPSPILTGIGHQRDEVIADLVAHQAFKTPTAVAEFLVQRMLTFETNLLYHFDNILKLTQAQIMEGKERLFSIQNRLKNETQQQLKDYALQIEQKKVVLQSQVTRTIEKQTLKLTALEKNIQLLDPKQILARGYSLVLKEGKLANEEEIEKGNQLEIITKKKKLEVEVIKISTHEKT